MLLGGSRYALILRRLSRPCIRMASTLELVEANRRALGGPVLEDDPKRVIGIVHGDLKPENALVFEGMVAKLADFGFSALASKQSIRLGGSQPWVALGV